MMALESETADDAKDRSIASLFEELEVPLLRYAYQLVKRPEVAQDLVQDAFLKLHAKQANVTQPKPWLYRTIHNMAVNYHRKENRIVPLPEEQDEGGSGAEQTAPEPMPDEYISRLEAIGQIRLALEKLAPKKRELIQLKFEEHLSYKEISARTGLSVGNVGYQLHHLLKSLASEIQESGVLQ